MSHYGCNVSEVKVDELLEVDKLGNALNALAENVVCLGECVEECNSAIGNELESLVGNNYERVNVLRELLNTLNCLIHSSLSLKCEGLGYDTNGENIHLVSDLSDYGSRARSCAAAHTCGNEYHICACERRLDLVKRLLSRSCTDAGVSACAKALGYLITDNHLLECERILKCLSVGIDSNKINTANVRGDHTVNCVVTAAAYANYLYTNAALAAIIMHETHFFIPPKNFTSPSIVI